jgi:hypothetical protein
MIVGRQWMIKTFKAILRSSKTGLLLASLFVLASCNFTELQPQNVISSVVTGDGTTDGTAYVYEDSPYVYAGANYGPEGVDMSSFLTSDLKLITKNNSLTANCSMFFFYGETEISDCIRSLSSPTATSQPLPRNTDKTYIFPPNSPEFYQVNGLYHLSQGADTFLKKLGLAYEIVNKMNALRYPKSIPDYLRHSNLFWFKALSSIDRRLFNTDYLTLYTQCDIEGNASFDPVGPSICLGGLKRYSNFFFVQDPSVIYHELGHGIVNIMLNLRNGTSTGPGQVTYHPFRSSLGFIGYDEAGSINEGISDYFSFVMNKRERFAEFALGTFNLARPLSEKDGLHSIPGIAETSEGRLSYPQYLLYDANDAEDLVEDVHHAGQIISHYLVALTKELKKECFSSEVDGGHDLSTSIVIMLLAETLSELGDLNAKGVDNFTTPLGGNTFFTNLDSTNSFLWAHFNNPITYRRFSQTMAKNIFKYVSNSSTQGVCTSFSKNKSEKLLDDYGLLLFRTYNDNGNSTKNAAIKYNDPDIVPNYRTPTLTPVSENNRRKSILVSKQLIELATRTDQNPTRVGYYVIDNNTDIEAFLKELIFKGFAIPLSSSVASTVYNNNNIRISPGEVVGIIPNLLNNSNSTMGGVQILATDWDHVHVEDQQTGRFKPCKLDNVTTEAQGAEVGQSCTSTDPNYIRLIKNKTSTDPYSVAPVCMVLSEEGDSTKWVSQNEFRKKQGLSLLDKDCLGFSTTQTSDQDFSFNPHECLVRFLPGANEAFFSKIEPQKTYYESVIKISKSGSFNAGNVLLLEANKWIPPGTKFRCRLRARFSNCSDCYNDDKNSNDDFIDSEYNGSTPFKVINFDFEIND